MIINKKRFSKIIKKKKRFLQIKISSYKMKIDSDK